jgi:hypothetical protein
MIHYRYKRLKPFLTIISQDTLILLELLLVAAC